MARFLEHELEHSKHAFLKGDEQRLSTRYARDMPTAVCAVAFPVVVMAAVCTMHVVAPFVLQRVYPAMRAWLGA